jgi:hypothetical protein
MNSRERGFVRSKRAASTQSTLRNELALAEAGDETLLRYFPPDRSVASDVTRCILATC